MVTIHQRLVFYEYNRCEPAIVGDQAQKTEEKLNDIKLSAKINGNTFSGTENGVSTEGIFVGAKATKMIGLFKDDNNKIQGAFGAKKQ